MEGDAASDADIYRTATAAEIHCISDGYPDERKWRGPLARPLAETEVGLGSSRRVYRPRRATRGGAATRDQGGDIAQFDERTFGSHAHLQTSHRDHIHCRRSRG